MFGHTTPSSQYRAFAALVCPCSSHLTLHAPQEGAQLGSLGEIRVHAYYVVNIPSLEYLTDDYFLNMRFNRLKECGQTYMFKLPPAYCRSSAREPLGVLLLPQLFASSMNAVATPRSVPESWSLANLAVSQSLQSHGTSVYVTAYLLVPQTIVGVPKTSAHPSRVCDCQHIVVNPSFNDSSSLTGVNYTGRLPLYSSTARIASTCLFRNVIGRNKTPGRRSLPVAPSAVRKKKSSVHVQTLEPADSATKCKTFKKATKGSAERGSKSLVLNFLDMLIIRHVRHPTVHSYSRRHDSAARGEDRVTQDRTRISRLACYTCLPACLPTCLPYSERPSEAVAGVAHLSPPVDGLFLLPFRRLNMNQAEGAEG
ncbi:hypothetical protein CABS01_12658 [Colletotrichum abscissum]|uniref:uncharacterized protein n=1 Tax=Colletotrichum abscissum TaxID=1671311 RepID=UPI0027D5518E|nr:uncharacterized protein CABS01_12658 [Colletotrichum abscissum]KAK1489507.1 hypothetical protein CABS01_12658 [Colletotrichum abscissum]